MLIKHFHMVQTQIDQLIKVQKDLLVNASREKHVYEINTRSGVSTQDPLYPEGHPKIIEQDSQRAKNNIYFCFIIKFVVSSMLVIYGSDVVS